MPLLRLFESDLDNLTEREIAKMGLLDAEAKANVYKQISENVRKLFWETFLTPLDNTTGSGMSLSEIYKYSEVKEKLSKRSLQNTLEFVDLPLEDITFIHKYFSAFNGWNPKATDIIIHADKALKEHL